MAGTGLSRFVAYLKIGRILLSYKPGFNELSKRFTFFCKFKAMIVYKIRTVSRASIWVVYCHERVPNMGFYGKVTYLIHVHQEKNWRRQYGSKTLL